MAQNNGAELRTSSLANHIDPKKDVQLKMTKTEIDEKAAKIIKLIKTSNLRKKGVVNPTKSEIIVLVEDFHKQYLSLYALHDDLREKVSVRENKDDEEEEDSYFSADERSISSSPCRDHIRKKSDEIYLKTENINADKETLNLEYMASLSKIQEYENAIEDMKIEAAVSQSKIQESEKIIKVLRIEAEEMEREKNKIFDEVSKLKEKYTESEKKLKTGISSLKLKGENLRSEKRDLQEKIEGNYIEIKNLGDENMKLQARIEELEKVSESEKKLKTDISSLKLEEENLHNEKRDLQEQIGGKDIEIKNLGDEILKLQVRVEELEKVSESEKKIEREISSLKIEGENLHNEKRDLQEQIEGKDIEIKNLGDANLKLQARVEELEKVSEREKKLEREISRLKLEGENLRNEKSDLQEKIEGKDIETKNLGDEILKLQARVEELEKVPKEKEDQLSALMKKLNENESEWLSKMNKADQELLGFRNQTIDLNETIDDMATDLRVAQEAKSYFESRVKDLEQKVDFVTSEKTQLEMQMEKKVKEAELLKVDNEELLDRISKLEKTRSGELLAIQADLKGLENNSSIKIKSSEEEVKKLQEKMKLNLKILERKIDETAAGFCKEFEDKVRILGRRIRVAEQLHMENKDIYIKTKEKYEKEHEGYKEMVETREVAVKMLRNISLATNEILDRSDTSTIKFNEQSENFLNRISKASCKVLFAKDWIKRKNEAIKSLQEDADRLVLEMGKKESEILELREKIQKLENKINELGN